MSNDFIKLPSSVLDMVADKDLWQLYGYLLSRVDENGEWVVSLKELYSDLKLTRQRFRTLLDKLRATTQLTTKSTTKSTTITLCVSANKSKPPTTQPTTQPTTKPTTKTELISGQKQEVCTAVVKNGYDRFLEYFNSKVEQTSIKQIKTLSAARKKAVRSIFDEFGKDVVDKALDKVVQSRWCCGYNDKGWIASFDWIFKKSNFIKIIEGNYDNRTNTGFGNTYSGQADRYAELDRAADAILRNAAYVNASQDDRG